MKKVRLHQYLSMTAEFSSKKAIYDAIRNGEISVNDKVTRIPGFQLRLTKPVFWKGRQLAVIRNKIYFMMNKPAGYLSSRLSENDKKMSKKSVFSLLTGVDEKTAQTLFCVGRLDEDTNGLLLITNDGNLSHKTANPIFEVQKSYSVEVIEPLTDAFKAQLEQGVEITLEENGVLSKHMTKPCTISFLDDSRKSILIMVHEGKKREIKRMLESVGNEVVKLQRISIGGLNLQELNIPEGHFKQVSKEFVLEKLGKK